MIYSRGEYVPESGVWVQNKNERMKGCISHRLGARSQQLCLEFVESRGGDYGITRFGR